MGTVSLEGGGGLTGEAYAFAVTDHYVWVRMTSGGPAVYNGMTNVIYRIDPATQRATPIRFLLDDGPLVGFGDRIAAADYAHLEIVRENGIEVAVPSLTALVGKATPPGTNGLQGMHFDARGLWAVHQGLALLLRIDPSTGKLIAAAPIQPGGARAPDPGHPIWWLPFGPPLVTQTGTTSLGGADLDAEGAALVVGRAPFNLNVLGSLEDGRVLVGRTGVLDPISGHLSDAPGPRGEVKVLVDLRGRQVIASWGFLNGKTTVTFWAVPPP